MGRRQLLYSRYHLAAFLFMLSPRRWHSLTGILTAINHGYRVTEQFSSIRYKSINATVNSRWRKLHRCCRTHTLFFPHIFTWHFRFKRDTRRQYRRISVTHSHKFLLTLLYYSVYKIKTTANGKAYPSKCIGILTHRKNFSYKGESKFLYSVKKKKKNDTKNRILISCIRKCIHEFRCKIKRNTI